MRVSLEQMTVLNKLAARRGTSVSAEVRRALDEAHDTQLEAVEWDGLSGGVTLTLKYVDGWRETMAFDVEQAQELARHLANAIEAAGA